jgi:three-Cys-motif partner protein
MYDTARRWKRRERASMPLELPAPRSGDGLPVSEIGSWAEDKYKLLFLYDSLFSTGMKNRWDCRVYIDLFSGPGLASVERSGRLMWGSPILALSVKDRFDKYIFCDTNRSYLDALKQRVSRVVPNADISYVNGDCNKNVGEICAKIPKASTTRKVLSFCFVDPFSLRLKFSTISRIADSFVDFLILLALHMDANRNERIYTNPRNHRIDDFLGQAEWRSRWRNRTAGIEFPRFLAEEYARQMETLGYLPVPFHRMKQVRSDSKNLPLYHLALFSRSQLAYEYWDDVLKYSSAQQQLFY